jgi:hypothetical protein
VTTEQEEARKKRAEEVLANAKTFFPPVKARRSQDVHYGDHDRLNSYIGALFAAGIFIDHTHKYQKSFRRCIPYPSTAEKYAMMNTLSLLIEDTRAPGKLWHMFGGQCYVVFYPHNNRERTEYFCHQEMEHCGLAFNGLRGQWCTRAQIKDYMLNQAGLNKDYIDRGLSLLRPRFPYGVYTDRQHEPKGEKLTELKKAGYCLITKEDSLQLAYDLRSAGKVPKTSQDAAAAYDERCRKDADRTAAAAARTI